MQKKYKIILADDHPVLRESIADAVGDFHSSKIEVVAQASDGREVLEKVKKHNPDLILLDLGMPQLDGIQVLQEIKKKYEKTIIIVFSMYDDQAHVVEAIRAGADDYLFKHEASPEDVVDHIVDALEKKSVLQNKFHEKIFRAIRRADLKSLDFGLTKLSESELKVLQLAAYHGLSMKEIAQKLSHKDKALSLLTVKKHFEHIYQKLHARSQTHAVCLAIKYGIISPDQSEPIPME